jgi:biopolymer transport protein ExbD
MRVKVFDVLDDDSPSRGTTLLCSASAKDPSLAPRGLPRTMFSDSLLTVLTAGHEAFGPSLSLSDVGELVRARINETYRDTGVRPEVHSPDQGLGDVARVPLFPNPAWVARAAAEQKVRDEVARLEAEAKAAAEQKARDEAARLEAEAKAAAEQKARDEAARLEAEAKAAAEHKARDEAARLEAEAKAAAEQKARDEAARLEAEAKAAAEQKALDEAARLKAEAKAAAEQKALDEAARLEAEAKAAAEQKALDEAARLKAEVKAAAEQKALDEAARLEAEAKAAAEQKAWHETASRTSDQIGPAPTSVRQSSLPRPSSDEDPGTSRLIEESNPTKVLFGDSFLEVEAKSDVTTRRKIAVWASVGGAILTLAIVGIFFVTHSTTPPTPKFPNVELWYAPHAGPMPDADKEGATVVTVTRDDVVYLGMDKVDPAQLERRLLSSRINKTVFVRADSRGHYGAVEDVIDIMRAAGAEDVGLLTRERQWTIQEDSDPARYVQLKSFGLEVSLSSAPQIPPRNARSPE